MSFLAWRPLDSRDEMSYRSLLELGGDVWMIEPPGELAREAEIVPWSIIAWHLQPALRAMLAVIREAIDSVKTHCCVVFQEIKLPGH